MSDEQFLQIVDITPLASLDLVVLHNDQVLLGERLNRPAQGYWFVPGGRIRKGERFTDAFQRLVMAELGRAMQYNDTQHLGVYEHFYSDSAFGPTASTHYIAIGLLVELSISIDELPQDQHARFSWWSIYQALESLDVHPYTKDYLRSLTECGN
ncbi:GDP-mannose mannosyl hydrolase [Halomonas sp.]|uniref:GDP-mannose mannosyl hydrolase n=1 Tax=Halomonas sp. TaxID=1486246 RepID=UPI00298E4827|nr:NUDIX domain-containing protein [Halomonas sp.]MDW7748901.1 NUDIX domain-containing protein [Halomonas sp.]